jgi:hypothetical protein
MKLCSLSMPYGLLSPGRESDGGAFQPAPGQIHQEREGLGLVEAEAEVEKSESNLNLSLSRFTSV